MRAGQFMRSLVLYVTVGSLVLLAACGGSSTSVASLVVVPTVSSVSIGGSQAFTANARDSSGNAISGGTLTWASSASGVASINTSGVATGLSAGTTQITATTSTNNITSAPVTLVVEAQVASLLVTPISPTIKVGAQQQFVAVAKDAQGNTLSGAVFTWTSSYSGVATISSSGLATAVAPGTVNVTATANNFTGPAVTLTVTN